MLNSLRKLTLAAALVFSTAGFAQESGDEEKALDQGWNAQWAMLFSLNNVLTSGSILSASGSGLATYFLTPTTAVRAGFQLSRSQNPVMVTETVTTVGSTSTTNYNLTATSPTESYGLGLQADYLMRLSEAAISPYIGAGAGLGWGSSSTSYTDDVSTDDFTTVVDNSGSSFGLNARGIAGAEWRVLPNFAIFAEYTLSVVLFQMSSFRNRSQTTDNTVSPAVSMESISTGSGTSFFEFNTGLAQGGTLGLEIFF